MEDLKTNCSKSRLSMIANEIRQSRQPENRNHIDHYLFNVAKILFGKEPIDYSKISHNNKIVHSYFYRY